MEKWELVFYGTETSLEMDDDLDKDNVDLSIVREEEQNGGDSVMDRHNSVDSNADRPWTGNQQIERVSHPEAQKPTAENHTSSGSAPRISTSGCARLDEFGRCLDCFDDAYLYENKCYISCPEKTYGVSNGIKSVCSPCHYTCETCFGPSEAECTSCQADATFVSSRCILQSVAWQMDFTKWHIVLTILLIVDLVGLIAGAIYFCIRLSRRNNDKYGYSRVSYSTNGKQLNEEEAILCENEFE